MKARCQVLQLMLSFPCSSLPSTGRAVPWGPSGRASHERAEPRQQPVPQRGCSQEAQCRGTGPEVPAGGAEAGSTGQETDAQHHRRERQELLQEKCLRPLHHRCSLIRYGAGGGLRGRWWAPNINVGKSLSHKGFTLS